MGGVIKGPPSNLYKKGMGDYSFPGIYRAPGALGGLTGAALRNGETERRKAIGSKKLRVKKGEGDSALPS